MQSISVRSARGGAIAAAAAVRQASLSTAAHCSLAAVRSTGDGGFLERCSGLSRRWRKRLSACARGVARCTALLLPLQVEPPSLDPPLGQPCCECSNDHFAHGKVAKEIGKTRQLIPFKTGLRAHFLVCAGAFDLHIAAGTPSCYFLAACEARRSADPCARCTAALLVWAPPRRRRGATGSTPRGMKAAFGAAGGGTAGRRVPHGLGRGTAPTSERPRDTHA